MFKNLLFLTGSLLLILASCKKKTEEAIPEPTPTKGIFINGDTYLTDTIGSQIWTTANYSGPGGFEHDQKPDYVHYGKYYTPEEANQIALPAGWRVPTRADYNKLLSNFTDLTDRDSDFYGHAPAFHALAANANWAVSSKSYTRFNAYPAGNALYDAVKKPALQYQQTDSTAIFVTSTICSFKEGKINYRGYYTLQIAVVSNAYPFCYITEDVYPATDKILYSLRFVKDK